MTPVLKTVLSVLAGFSVLVIAQHLCCFVKGHYGVDFHHQADKFLTTWIRPLSSFQERPREPPEVQVKNQTSFASAFLADTKETDLLRKSSFEHQHGEEPRPSAPENGAQEQETLAAFSADLLDPAPIPAPQNSLAADWRRLRRLQEKASSESTPIRSGSGPIGPIPPGKSSGRRRRMSGAFQDKGKASKAKKTDWEDSGEAWTVSLALPPSPSPPEDLWDATRRRKPQQYETTNATDQQKGDPNDADDFGI